MANLPLKLVVSGFVGYMHIVSSGYWLLRGFL